MHFYTLFMHTNIQTWVNCSPTLLFSSDPPTFTLSIIHSLFCILQWIQLVYINFRNIQCSSGRKLGLLESSIMADYFNTVISYVIFILVADTAPVPFGLHPHSSFSSLCLRKRKGKEYTCRNNVLPEFLPSPQPSPCNGIKRRFDPT